MPETVKHASTVFNKVIIPVVTTVLGATAIYFLGFNKKGGRSDMEQLLITKEATIKGWKTFVTSENIGYKNVQSISDEYGEKIANEAKLQKGFESLVPVLKDFEKDLFRETKKVTLDIENILKDEDLDKGFISMLNRSLDNGAEEEKKITSFFDDLTSLAKSDLDDQEKAQKWEKETAAFLAINEQSTKRAATEAEDIARSLSERYGQTFDLNELLVYVDYKKEKEKKKNKNTSKEEDNDNKDSNGPAPTDPNKGGTEYVNNDDDNSRTSNINTNREEINASALFGKWIMNGGSLNLYKDHSLYWVLDAKGYTTGTWKISGNQLQMNATNPDTKKKFLMVYEIALAGNSLTLTSASNPSEVYSFSK